MKKIFLLTVIVTSFITCNSDNGKTSTKTDDDTNLNGMLGPIADFFIRLVDREGNWIKGIEEKEMQLLVADSNWNILEEQPDNTPGVFHAPSLWKIEKIYNYIKGEEEDTYIKTDLSVLSITTFFKHFLSYRQNNETYGDYIVLKIDENTSLNIQLFHKEYYNHVGPCIEKFICNGIEYINLESYTYYHNGRYIESTRGPKINDIIIE